MSKWELFKFNIFLRLFGLIKIPLVAFICPRIVEVSEARTQLMVPLKRRNKNHLGTMYFGAISIGAEVCAAMLAVKKIHDSKMRIDFVFKDFKANFLKRAEGDVLFVCDDALLVSQLVHQAIESKERVHQLLKVAAYVPSLSATEKIAEFEITLSIKRRG